MPYKRKSDRVADVRSLARRHTESAIKTLVGIMGSAKAGASARTAAAVALLDRGFGKPHQSQDIAVTDTSVESIGPLETKRRLAFMLREAEESDEQATTH